MKRAYTLSEINQYQPDTITLTGAWHDAIGNPQLTGSWIIWGESANGKTRFALQLARLLATHVKVAYNSLEEGLSLSIKQAIQSVGMADVKRNFVLLDKESIRDLSLRLSRRRAPQVIIIDSLQYSALNYTRYQQLIDRHRGRLFIFISHADSRGPKGSTARSIRYDAFVKIRVEGYKAFPQSRFGGGTPYTIWQHGADRYWGETTDNAE